MKLRIAIPVLMLVALTGCGGSGGSNSSSTSASDGLGATIPAQFVGTWAADCTSPFVKFNSDGTMHVYPDNADYTLKSATLSGGILDVAYATTDRGTITDSYASEGATLRLTKTASDQGGEASWTKAPMSKCP